MSLYSIIGIIAFAVVAAVGITMKIVLSHKRKKLDGVHGYVHEPDSEDTPADGWKML